MHPDSAPLTSFKYPRNRLLPLQGVIEEDELYYPKMHDANGERVSLSSRTVAPQV